MKLASVRAGIYTNVHLFPEIEHSHTFLLLNIQRHWTTLFPSFINKGFWCQLGTLSPIVRKSVLSPWTLCLFPEATRVKGLSLVDENRQNEVPLTFTTSSPSTIFNFSKFSCSSCGFIRHLSRPSKPTKIESRQAELLPKLSVSGPPRAWPHIRTPAHTRTHAQSSQRLQYHSGWALWSTPA